MGQGCLPTDNLADHAGNKGLIGLQFGKLVRVLMQCQHGAAHGIAGCVIAPDDEKHEIAQKLHGLHIPGGGIVGEHGYKIELWRRFRPLFPEPGKILQAFHQNSLPLFFGYHTAHIGAGSGHVGPVG